MPDENEQMKIASDFVKQIQSWSIPDQGVIVSTVAAVLVLTLQESHPEIPVEKTFDLLNRSTRMIYETLMKELMDLPKDAPVH